MIMIMASEDNFQDRQKIGIPGIWIPGEILYNPFLNFSHKILFGIIRNLCKSERGCWATNSYLSKFVGYDKITVSSLLADLKNYGYIKIIHIKIKDGSLERRIYETIDYPRLYETLVQIFHNHLDLSSPDSLAGMLKDEIRRICCPNDRSNFNEKLGFWSSFPDDFERDKGLPLDKKDEGGGLTHRLMGINLQVNVKNIIEEYNKGESKKILLNDPDGSTTRTLSRFQRTSPVVSPEKQHVSVPEKISRDFIKPGTGEYAVVLSWNKLPSPARKHTELNTKLMKKASQHIDQIKNGVFGKGSRRRWDGAWLDRHKIDQRKFEEKKWAVREICGTIEGPLADMYREGYWPEKKEGLPKSLTEALYNPRSHTSFFVLAYYDPPGTLKSRSPLMKDPYPDITDELLKTGVLGAMTPGDWVKYYGGVRGMAEFLKDVDWNEYGARQLFPGGKQGKPFSLVLEYVRWMKGENPDLLSPSKIPGRWHFGMIRPDFWMWRKFMEAVNRYWGRVFKSIEMEES